MSDKETYFGQYVAQGEKDGATKEAVTRPTAPDDRTKAIKPAPEVK
jgi:hypothetical protein